VDCEKIIELISFYIDESISDNDKSIVEEHIKSCQSCQNYFNELKSIINQVNNIEDVELPENFHSELMGRVKNSLSKENNVIDLSKFNWKKISSIAAVFFVAFLGINLSMKHITENNIPRMMNSYNSRQGNGKLEDTQVTEKSKESYDKGIESKLKNNQEQEDAALSYDANTENIKSRNIQNDSDGNTEDYVNSTFTLENVIWHKGNIVLDRNKFDDINYIFAKFGIEISLNGGYFEIYGETFEELKKELEDIKALKSENISEIDDTQLYNEYKNSLIDKMNEKISDDMSQSYIDDLEKSIAEIENNIMDLDMKSNYYLLDITFK